MEKIFSDIKYWVERYEKESHRTENLFAVICSILIFLIIGSLGLAIMIFYKGLGSLGLVIASIPLLVQIFWMRGMKKISSVVAKKLFKTKIEKDRKKEREILKAKLDSFDFEKNEGAMLGSIKYKITAEKARTILLGYR